MEVESWPYDYFMHYIIIFLSDLSFDEYLFELFLA